MSAVPENLQQSTPSVEGPSLAGVLAEIAETTSETLELQGVFERIAIAVRRLVPLDSMGVVRILDGEKAMLHAISVLGKAPDTPDAHDAEGGQPRPVACSLVECAEPAPLISWSPRVRPRSGPITRIDDAATEL